MLLNLNADLGESFGPWKMGDDHNLLSVLDSANVACGFHAGDPKVMVQTVERAKSCEVSVGAHPGFADLQGFGRRPMHLSDSEIKALVHYQLGALRGIARCAQWKMTHVKPHGALNNMACDDAKLAHTIASAVYEFDNEIIFLAPVLSELAAEAKRVGLCVALEVFADRRYADNGSLMPRKEAGSVLDSTDACIEHVQAMIDAGGVLTHNNTLLPTEFHSICVHGDNEHAVTTARLIRNSLLDDGHELLPLPQLMSRLD
ncbi:MAG: LamB/YcsF family protein [Granulosicoccus sp.]|nr:LamB/YcsF family protein [Granulosicoccus sp.]